MLLLVQSNFQSNIQTNSRIPIPTIIPQFKNSFLRILNFLRQNFPKFSILTHSTCLMRHRTTFKFIKRNLKFFSWQILQFLLYFNPRKRVIFFLFQNDFLSISFNNLSTNRLKILNINRKRNRNLTDNFFTSILDKQSEKFTFKTSLFFFLTDLNTQIFHQFFLKTEAKIAKFLIF